MKDNPQLAMSPLVEVVLEIRFKSKGDYSLLLGQLVAKLAAKYPNARPLAPAQVPFGIPLVLRHKFLSNDETKLFQIGEDVLSVNFLKYKSFATFKNAAKEILNFHKAVFNADIVTRIGLRYINKITETDNLASVLSFSLPLPSTITKKKEIVFNRAVFDYEQLGKLGLITETNFTDKQILLDFDMFNEMNSDFDTTKLLAWMDDAHEEIYKVFVSSLQPKYYKSLASEK